MVDLSEFKKEELEEERKQAQEYRTAKAQEQDQEIAEGFELTGRAYAFRLLREDKNIQAIIKAFREGASHVGWSIPKIEYERMFLLPNQVRDGVVQELNDYFEHLGIEFSFVYWEEKRVLKSYTKYTPWWICVLDRIAGANTNPQRVIEEDEIQYEIILSFKED